MDNIYKVLLNKVNSGSQCVMLTYLNLYNNKRGAIIEKILLTNEDIENKTLTLDENVYNEINIALDTGKLRTIHTEEKKAILIEPFISKPRLIVFGGGHIAKPLVEFAARVGFLVTVIDDRPSFANTERFPEAETVICESFEKSFDNLSLRKTDYIVIVTRGHRHDGVVLRKVLEYDFTYVGMIGSKRRVNGMMKELLEEGFPKDQLDLINSPIGLDIGAITPDEIAISIVGELISVKNKGTKSKSGETFILPEFDIDVMQEVCKESSVPRAIITIISSKGSVPRKTGAKMLVCLDGRTIGSIGGGCSEAEVLTKARQIMTEKGFLIEDVDMTGDVAEAEGMVCGGIMEVIIEIL